MARKAGSLCENLFILLSYLSFMFIRSVKLHNIRSYVSEEVVFPAGSVLLSGDIGSGKSTILLAVEFGLFGLVKGSVEGSTLLRHGSNSGYVELCFELDGREVVVHRVLRRGKDAVSQSSGWIAVDGIKTECTHVELKARVLDLLGYPRSLVAKSKALIYRYTVYTPQEEMKRILFEEASARLDTLRRVFQIDSYKLIRDNAAVVVHSLKERIAWLSARAEGFEGKQAQLVSLLAQLNSIEAALAVILAGLSAVQQKISACEEVIKSYDSGLASLNSLKSELSACSAALSERQRMLASYKSERDSCAADLAACSVSLSKSSAASADFGSALGVLSYAVSELGSGLSEKAALKSGVERLQESLNSVLSGLGRAQASLESSRKLKSGFLDSEACPVCLQPVSEAHRRSFHDKIESELSSSERVIAGMSFEKSRLSAELFSVQQKLDALADKERSFSELSAFYKRFSSSASEFGISEVAFSGSYGVSSVLAVLSSSERVLRDAQRVSSVAGEKSSRIASLDVSISSVSSSVGELLKRQSALMVELAAYSSLESDYASARGRLAVLQQEEKGFLVKKASLGKEIEGINVNIVLLRQEISVMEGCRKELAHLVQLKGWVGEFFVNLMGVVERSVMLRVYSEFNSLFRGWFGVLMEGDSVSARLDDSFSPVVEVNGYETSLESLSGGEKTSCALAYRLALNRVINDIIGSVKTSQLIILDEPTDGFSGQQLEKVREVLEQLNLSQVIIVSHEQKVESFVEHVIRIVKEQHVSRALA